MKVSLEHLPVSKREQLAAIAELVRSAAPVEMVILFGSHARGDWVEDPESGYFSDFDILVVVAAEEAARDLPLWSGLTQRARQLAGRTPVTLIVHDIKEINSEIRLGQYFFVDILREGIELYTSRRHTLATPKALDPRDRLALGVINFRYWFGSASGFWRLSGHSAGSGLLPHAAFLLHQAVERYFHAAILVHTGYKPKTHNIEDLAIQAAPLHAALAGALPRAEPEDARLFSLLRRAYIEARYSKAYKITLDELRILRERVLDLGVRVRQACAEKLASFCGAGLVGELPEVPSVVDLGELPGAPSFDDEAAFQAWREALTALTFERGKEAGDKQGFERGKEAGDKQGFERGDKEGFGRGKGAGLAEALFTILAARGIPVDVETRARVEACTEPALLHRWIARATVVTDAAGLFVPEPGEGVTEDERPPVLGAGTP